MKVELSVKELTIIIQALQIDIISDETISMNDQTKKDLLERLNKEYAEIN